MKMPDFICAVRTWSPGIDHKLNTGKWSATSNVLGLTNEYVRADLYLEACKTRDELQRILDEGLKAYYEAVLWPK